jgi:phenolic acid decarboxylase
MATDTPTFIDDAPNKTSMFDGDFLAMFETARGSSNQTPKKFQHLLRLADLVG